jgi:hypothetical protein
MNFSNYMLGKQCVGWIGWMMDDEILMKKRWTTHFIIYKPTKILAARLFNFFQCGKPYLRLIGSFAWKIIKKKSWIKINIQMRTRLTFSSK